MFRLDMRHCYYDPSSNDHLNFCPVACETLFSVDPTKTAGRHEGGWHWPLICPMRRAKARRMNMAMWLLAYLQYWMELCSKCNFSFLYTWMMIVAGKFVKWWTHPTNAISLAMVSDQLWGSTTAGQPIGNHLAASFQIASRLREDTNPKKTIGVLLGTGVL